jgi:hypothetical protein
MRGSCAAATAGRVRRLAIRDLYTALSRSAAAQRIGLAFRDGLRAGSGERDGHGFYR